MKSLHILNRLFPKENFDYINDKNGGRVGGDYEYEGGLVSLQFPMHGMIVEVYACFAHYI